MNPVYQTQKTIQKKGLLSGVGIHTGDPSTVVFEPAPADSGIQFFKKGVRIESLVVQSSRCTSVGTQENQIKTIEHLTAALHGLGITNVKIFVEGEEIPCLDGSALDFVKFLKGLGLVDLGERIECYKITEPIFCYEKNKALAAYPADEFRVAYILDYDHPHLRNQKVEFTLSPEVFESEIAPARTFCTEVEAAELRRQGVGLGANTENTLVISKDGAAQSRLRFSDECARHKVLDLVGDLSLLGFPVLGHVVGLRSGHALNQKLAEVISAQRCAGGK